MLKISKKEKCMEKGKETNGKILKVTSLKTILATQLFKRDT